MAQVVIAGAGALGSLYGGLLTEAGADVALLARGAHADAMRARGLELRMPDGSVRTVRVRVEDEAGGAFILLTAKAYDSVRVVGQIIEAPTLAVSFQNGLKKNDVLVARFGRGAVTGGVSMAAAEVLEPGVVACTTIGVTYLGRPAEDLSSDPTDVLAELLVDAGFPVHVVDEIESVEWTKLAAVCGLMVLQLLSQRFVHELLRDGDAGYLMKAIATDVDQLAKSRGIELRDWPGLIPARTLADGTLEDAATVLRASADRLEAGGATSYRTSLLQDYAAGRRTEFELIHGELSRVAAEERVPVPSFEACYRLGRLLVRN